MRIISQNPKHKMAQLLRVMSGLGCKTATQMTVHMRSVAAVGTKRQGEVGPGGGDPPRLQGGKTVVPEHVKLATIEVRQRETDALKHLLNAAPLPPPTPPRPLVVGVAATTACIQETAFGMPNHLDGSPPMPSNACTIGSAQPCSGQARPCAPARAWQRGPGIDPPMQGDEVPSTTDAPW